MDTKHSVVRQRIAFTLIEILVVVAIIGLLVAILFPSLAKARAQTKRTVCATNLRQIGAGFASYLPTNRDRMPEASYMPSVGPGPLAIDKQPISIADVLLRHVGGQKEVFHCSEDKSGVTDREAPNTGKTYFETERSSYEYRFWLAGKTPQEFNNTRHHEGEAPETIWVMRDYENFHAKAGQPGARRYLYIDGHVSDYEN